MSGTINLFRLHVPAGKTLMTITLSEEDLEKLKLEGTLNSINYGGADLSSFGNLDAGQEL